MKATCRGHLSSLLLALLLAVLARPCFATSAPGSAKVHDAPQAEGIVTLGDVQILTLEATRGGMSPRARAARASRALEDTLRAGNPAVSVTWSNGAAVVRAGDRVVVELGEADREGSPHESLVAYVDDVASRMRQTLKREHQRRQIAARVLGVSSIAFLGILAWLAMGFTSKVAGRAEKQLEENPKSFGAIKIHGVELIPAAATREGARLSIVGALWVVRIGIVYSWSLLALSLFGPTRAYASRATGYLFTPAIELVGRLAERIPILLALFFALLVVLLIVRFIRLYCGAVERREIDNRWLRPETANTSATLLIVVVCLAALLFLTPLLAGNSDGALTRIGLLGVFAISLGATPVVGSCLLGIRIIYGGAWSFGDLVEYGGEKGRVVRMDLFDATLRREDGAIVRVPHLMSLWRPTRIYPPPPPAPADAPSDSGS